MTATAQAQSATPTTSLPTLEQTMRLACTLVLGSLHLAIDDAARDGHWCDEFHDSVCAAEMAEAEIKRLSATLPCDQDTFDRSWWSAHAVTRLAAVAFPKKDCAAWRHLEGAVQAFETMHSAVDTVVFSERRAKTNDS